MPPGNEDQRNEKNANDGRKMARSGEEWTSFHNQT
jgi:hypothetical protein